jgi:hypothetical protein
MKTTLSQLTLAQFIELECGKLEVLKDSHHEVVTPQRLIEVRGDISREFQSIASPSSYKSMVVGREKTSKLRAKAILFGALMSLAEIEAFDDVRSIMTSAGIDCSRFDDKKLKVVVEQRLNDVTFELKRMGLDVPSHEDVTPEAVRRSYEGMVADLMIAYKMSIDIETIRASVFASMIHKANEMAKAMNEKIKSKK